jgi:hypothetical protein
MSSSTPRPQAGAEEIASRFETSAEAKAVLTPGIGASEFVTALVEKELWSDAVGFVGQWLDKRGAVSWACLASREALGEAPPPKERAALEAAEKWLAAPDEPSRRACEAAAEALGYRSAPAMAAAAAFWSGGSLSGPDLPKVSPAETLGGKGAAASVLMAGAAGAPDVPGRLRELIWLGVDIAEGRHRPGVREARISAPQARSEREG